MTIVFNHTQRFDDYRFEDPGLNILTREDYTRAVRILKGPRPADLVIAPDGHPYLYRWHLYRESEVGFNQYLHIQVASDPKSPLHDHPWDNVSTILAGGYVETTAEPVGPSGTELQEPGVFRRVPGEVIRRHAFLAHRLELLEGVPYTMTLFTTGPKFREWGFWYPEGWINHKEVVRIEGNKSIHVERPQ